VAYASFQSGFPISGFLLIVSRGGFPRFSSRLAPLQAHPGTPVFPSRRTVWKLGVGQQFPIGAEQTRHGVRYAIDGPLTAPDGAVLNVRTAWYIGPNDETPRFVTAYPLRKP